MSDTHNNDGYCVKGFYLNAATRFFTLMSEYSEQTEMAIKSTVRQTVVEIAENAKRGSFS